jgi:hypothetical protein
MIGIRGFGCLAALAMVACSTTTEIRKDTASADGGKPQATPDQNNAMGSTSGSRLKVKSVIAEDGARHFNGWRDTARDVDCSFQRAGDGTLRCLPVSLTVSPSWYGDAACSKPLAYGSKGCEALATATSSEGWCAGSGALATKLYSVVGPYRGSSIYTKSGDECTASPAKSYESYALFTIGAEVAPSDFVAAEETIE